MRLSNKQKVPKHTNTANQELSKQLYDQQSQSFLLMPIVSIAGNSTIVEFSISTHHITVISHNKMTNSKRTSESERTPLIQRMKGKHNRKEICCLCGKWEGYSQWEIQFTLSHRDRDCPYERERGAHDPAPHLTMLIHRLHVDL